MKIRDIEVGKRYYVRIPKDVDEVLYTHDSPQGRRWRWDQHRVYAEVIEKGVERDVVEYVTYGGIAGTPRVACGSHKQEGGIRIRFTDHNGRERVLVVPSRSIQWEVDADNNFVGR